VKEENKKRPVGSCKKETRQEKGEERTEEGNDKGEQDCIDRNGRAMARTNTAIVGSNPTAGHHVCPRFY
jgi:hypothetical protein